MMIPKGTDPIHRRLALTLLGGLAASGLWALTEAEALQDRAPGLFLMLLAGLSIWAWVSLALAGPLRLGRALSGALVLAIPAAGFLRLAGQRHLQPLDVLEAPGTLTIFLLAVFVATPFLSVALERRHPVLSYPALFETAWSITIRFAAAGLFTGVVWGLLYLSDALLGIVGIDAIEHFIDIDGVPAAITGAALGLGIAVIHELREVVSPLLLLRLLRLLVWPVLAVVAVFLVAVPLRGLSGLMLGLSSGGTLMGVAMGAVTLITCALGRDDTEAMRPQIAPRLLALSVPLLAALAVWAVTLRVTQYGLTPDRVMAGTVALVLLVYGLVYAVVCLRATGWMGRLRWANVWLALLVVAVSCAWLTPLLDAERLSARSQVTRFADGRATTAQLPLWQMQTEWGRAGQDALAELEALTDHPEHAALVAAIDAVRRGERWHRALTDPGGDRLQMATDLAGWVQVRPDGALDPEKLADVVPYWLEQWHQLCAPQAGTQPPCVFVRGRFAADLPAADQGVMIERNADGGHIAQHIRWPDAEVTPVDSAASLPADAVARILAGEVPLTPVETEALDFGTIRIAPGLRAGSLPAE